MNFLSILKVAMTFIAEHLWKISTSFCIEEMPLTQRFSSKPSPSSIRDVNQKFWLNWTELQIVSNNDNESKFQVLSASLSLSEPLLHHWQLPPARPGAQLAGEGPLFQDGGPQAGAVSVRRLRIHKERRAENWNSIPSHPRKIIFIETSGHCHYLLSGKTLDRIKTPGLTSLHWQKIR